LHYFPTCTLCVRVCVCVQVQMQAALRQALQGVTQKHLEAATGAGPAADLCQLPSAAHLAAGGAVWDPHLPFQSLASQIGCHQLCADHAPFTPVNLPHTDKETLERHSLAWITRACYMQCSLNEALAWSMHGMLVRRDPLV
jgi:hypothetical protein